VYFNNVVTVEQVGQRAIDIAANTEICLLLGGDIDPKTVSIPAVAASDAAVETATSPKEIVTAADIVLKPVTLSITHTQSFKLFDRIEEQVLM
jgi:hypothetical protein